MPPQSRRPPTTAGLITTSVVAALIAAIWLASSLYGDYRATFDNATALTAQAARLLEEHAKHYVQAPEQALLRVDERFAARPVESMAAEDVRVVAAQIAVTLPQVSSIVIVDRRGDVVMVSHSPRFTPFNVADRAYFHKHMKEGWLDTYVGPAVLSREPLPHPSTRFTISRPLTRQGRVDGVIIATIDVAFFERFYRSLELGPDSTSAVFNFDGWLVARQNLTPNLIETRPPNLIALQQTKPSGSFTSEGAIDDIPRIMSYRRIPTLRLVVVSGISVETALAGWRRRAVSTVTVALGMLALVQAALWLTWTGIRRERDLVQGLHQALADNRMLFNEIHHRVKNNLQIVTSMLMMEQVRAGHSPLADRLQALAERVTSMALVHTMLYQRGEAARVDVAAYLQELCGNLSQSHGAAERNIAVTVQSEDCQLSVEKAVPLGLVVNEAVSNAMKHAFPDGRTGAIDVRLSCGPGGVAVEVRDDGIGLPATPAKQGVGLSIMNALARQLGADLRLEREEGTALKLNLPEGCCDKAA